MFYSFKYLTKIIDLFFIFKDSLHKFTNAKYRIFKNQKMAKMKHFYTKMIKILHF